MLSHKEPSRFYVEYDLGILRSEYQRREPAPHQNSALIKLREWYSGRTESGRGGILVLPTGGGKTFTAVHFSCSLPLSDGAKVLWLAHTHHLLEQAFDSFADSAGSVREPKSHLRIRLISGMGGEHFPIHSVKPADDVVISSLPTACRALQQSHQAFLDFLDASDGKLLVVFDEAHHAPAPSFRNFLRELRLLFPKLVLLGLTATPTYGDSSKIGWLTELFPQKIVYQVTANELMQQGILAKPVFHEERTQFSPVFNEGDYKKWLGTHRDVPEEIVSVLASQQQRNDYIIGTYADQRTKWGKNADFRRSLV